MDSKTIWLLFFQKVILLILGSYITLTISNRLMSTTSTDVDSKRVKQVFGNLKNLTDYEKLMSSNIVLSSEVSESYEDIVGLDSQVDMLKRLVVEPCATAEKRKTINGLVLHGVPGTGKTLLARATAKALGCPFLNFSITSIEDKYVGESNRRLEAVFTLARKLGKCVIFFDEADAIMSKRNYSMDQNHVNSLKTNLLQLMDGFSNNDGTIFIAATNNLQNMDKAFLRRLRLRVKVPLPDQKAIQTLIFKKLNIQSEDLSKKCWEGNFSGSDVSQLCILASYECGGDPITEEHLKKGFEMMKDE